MWSTILVSFLWPMFSLAFRLEPMVVTVPLQGAQATATYTVENSTKEKVALQFEVRQRLIREDGVEERPTTEGFFVYPEQLSLDPGQKRNVRVSWKGNKIPDQELAYRFIATQLPVEFSKEKQASKKANLKFLLEYVASLYLLPPGAKPQLKVVSTKVEGGSLQLEIENTGTAHQLLEDIKIHFVSDGKEEFLPEKELAKIRSENLLAKSKRRFVLPLDPKLRKKQVKVTFSE